MASEETEEEPKPIGIADAKPEITCEDANGHRLYIIAVEDAERLRYYGLRDDGVEIKNPDYKVYAPHMDGLGG